MKIYGEGRFYFESKECISRINFQRAHMNRMVINTKDIENSEIAIAQDSQIIEILNYCIDHVSINIDTKREFLEKICDTVKKACDANQKNYLKLCLPIHVFGSGVANKASSPLPNACKCYVNTKNNDQKLINVIISKE